MTLDNIWFDICHFDALQKALTRQECDKAEIVTFAQFNIDCTDDTNITENAEFFNLIHRLNVKAFSAVKDLLHGEPEFAVDFIDGNGIKYCLSAKQRGIYKDIILAELFNSQDFGGYAD